MKKIVKTWAFVNKKTGNVVWTTKGHPAVWSKQYLAQKARKSNLVPSDAKLVKLEGRL